MGKYGVHAAVGAFAFLFTLLVSIGNNTFATSMVRAFYGFIIFFIVMFPISWFFRRKGSHEPPVEVKAGQNVNVQTPEDDLLKQLSADKLAERPINAESKEFVPLAPPTIRKKTDKGSAMDAEEIANAVRILSNQ